MTALANLLARLREDVDVVVERDPSIGSRREALLHPHLIALWLHRVAHRRYEHRKVVSARAVATLARILSGVDIHPGATVGRRFFVDHGSAVVVGETAVIGDDVTLYQQVTLGSVGWRPGRGEPPTAKRHPTVCDGVTIGANASVLGPIVVGEGALVGAHSLVMHDVPAHARIHAVEPEPAAVDHRMARRPAMGLRGIVR